MDIPFIVLAVMFVAVVIGWSETWKKKEHYRCRVFELSKGEEGSNLVIVKPDRLPPPPPPKRFKRVYQFVKTEDYETPLLNRKSHDSLTDGYNLDREMSTDRLLVFVKHEDIDKDPENAPFSAKWLKDHIDLEDPRLNDGSVIVDIDDDIISDERGEAGCIDIHYMSQVFWTISKGLASEKWLCSCSPEFRSDDWIPSIYSIADFKRLFRVATGFDLPLKR